MSPLSGIVDRSVYNCLWTYGGNMSNRDFPVISADSHITDETWAALNKHFDKKQIMDLVFTVGQYNLVSMALNTFGVQLDDGLPDWDLNTR